MIDEEDRDARVVRRWREQKLASNPPLDLTEEETAYVERMMTGWKPKPYVHPFDDTIYQDQEDTYPWERPGWDPVAAMSSDYVVPREATETVRTDADQSLGLEDHVDGDRISLVTPAPVKSDPMWMEPSPGDKARVTALVAAGWSPAKMAGLLDMTRPQFEWAFHDTLKTAALAMEARMTTAIFADAIAAPGAARNRVADFMGVFKEKPEPARPTTMPRTGGPDPKTNKPMGASVKPFRKRWGGPLPKPDPEGRICGTLAVGDNEMRARFDVVEQAEARKYELINAYRAAKARGAG